MLEEIYSYDCKGEEVVITHEDRRERVKFVKGYPVWLCSECCNKPVYHLVRREWREE